MSDPHGSCPGVLYRIIGILVGEIIREIILNVRNHIKCKLTNFLQNSVIGFLHLQHRQLTQLGRLSSFWSPVLSFKIGSCCPNGTWFACGRGLRRRY